MSQIRCEKCQQPVEATAEHCPHCKHFQPEAMFRAGIEHVSCPACQVKNYVYQPVCRACGAALAQVRVNVVDAMEERLDLIGEVLYRAKHGAMLGAICLVVINFLNGSIQAEAKGDGMTMLILIVIVGFAGALIGWIVGFVFWTSYQLLKFWRRPGQRQEG
jgi:hypothetical protein